jgi:hypothetical protein
MAKIRSADMAIADAFGWCRLTVWMRALYRINSGIVPRKMDGDGSDCMKTSPGIKMEKQPRTDVLYQKVIFTKINYALSRFRR